MKTIWPTPAELESVTTHQRERYALATAGPVGVLGGNPGVGKSFVTAAIIKAAIRRVGPSQIAVAAPTGKAAQRLNEILGQHQVHGIEAMTVHRMLGVSRNGHDGKGWGFLHGTEHPLRRKYVFVDEVSMCGTGLMASLVAALAPGTHALFIGDFAQLPPVEHGAPLRDLIAAGLPYGELTEVHRNGGAIVAACAAVKEGRPMRPSPCVNLECDEPQNLMHIEARRPSLVLSQLAQLLRRVPAGIDPVWDTQVICPLKKQGSSELAQPALNRLLQSTLNPDGEQREGCRFRLDDKVICTTNQLLPLVGCPSCRYDSQIEWRGKEYSCDSCGRAFQVREMAADFVANGEIGRVALLDKGFVHVTFDAPARTVRVSAGVWNDFDLAYAVTCHKGQGSQWPVVFVVVDDSKGADLVTSFEWHRTAWSRAQRLCFTIGRLATIHRQCRKSALRERKTFLTELLQESDHG